MFSEGIYPIGDGLLDIDEKHFKGLLVQDDINEIYDVEQTPFARGKFAAVRRAIHRNSGVHFAAKFLKRRRRAQSSDKEIKHEIAVLMLCSGSDNIVQLNAVHESRSDTALLLELATGGELQTFLDNEECLSEAQARICMREVLKALQFLHNRSIAHLDLKPQNILLTSERIEDGLKLCDFGISRVVADGSNVREIVGTPDYVAPEVLQYEPLSLQTDIWSVGVLTYVLLSGFSPFGGDTKQETFLNISQCALTFPDKLFNGVSGAAIDFMRRALRIKPNDRMTALGCLDHIWLKDECTIDRQIFNNISKATAVENEDCDDEDGDLNDDDEDDDGDPDDGNEVVDANGRENGSEESADDDHMQQEQKQHRNNGKIHLNGSESSSSSTSASKYSAKSNGNSTTNYCSSLRFNGSCHTTASALMMNGGSSSRIHCNGGKSTTMVSAAATRATTSPITMLQHHHHNHSSSLLVAPRRHSSDSNKENHNFLAKKYTSINGGGGPAAVVTKKPTTTATATIIISPTGAGSVSCSGVAITNSSIITTASSPSTGGSGIIIEKSTTTNNICLFPDAPTTPKVIRKAPTSDTSPTSVKALVKKFQFQENNGIGGGAAVTNGSGGVTCTSPLPSSSLSSSSTQLLKEAQQNNHQQHQQQRHQHCNQSVAISTNNINERSSIAIGNATSRRTATTKSLATEKTNNNSSSSYNINNRHSQFHHHHHHNSSRLNSSRRNPTSKSPSPSQEDISIAANGVSSTTSHQKLSTAGCNSTSNSTIANASSTSVSSTTSNGCNTTSSSNNCSSYKSTCVFCLTCSGPGCRHSGSTSAAAAIMISQKSTTNTISLDQGIIC